jgi:hypothetical protein
MSVLNDDENKTFGVTFRTPVADSKGTPHILEHSVLCGSKKYPVKVGRGYCRRREECVCGGEVVERGECQLGHRRLALVPPASHAAAVLGHAGSGRRLPAARHTKAPVAPMRQAAPPPP